MIFAQLSYRESLRDIVVCLRSQAQKLYHNGFRSIVSRSTLADANEVRDWRIYPGFRSWPRSGYLTLGRPFKAGTGGVANCASRQRRLNSFVADATVFFIHKFARALKGPAKFIWPLCGPFVLDARKFIFSIIHGHPLSDGKSDESRSLSRHTPKTILLPRAPESRSLMMAKCSPLQFRL
jgi:hypothetical protein